MRQCCCGPTKNTLDSSGRTLALHSQFGHHNRLMIWRDRTLDLRTLESVSYAKLECHSACDTTKFPSNYMITKSGLSASSSEPSQKKMNPVGRLELLYQDDMDPTPRTGALKLLQSPCMTQLHSFACTPQKVQGPAARSLVRRRCPRPRFWLQAK